jgi:hypothetical protein
MATESAVGSDRESQAEVDAVLGETAERWTRSGAGAASGYCQTSSMTSRQTAAARSSIPKVRSPIRGMRPHKLYQC